MKKILTCTLLCLALLLSLASAPGGSARAAGQKPTALYVGPSGNLVGGGAGPVGVSYDKNTNVLSLLNYSLTECHIDGAGSEAYGIMCNGDLTIEVLGTCSIAPACGSASVTELCGISVSGNLTIRNGRNYDATLTVAPKKTGTAAEQAYGVYSHNQMTIQNDPDGGSITVDAAGDAVSGSATSTSAGIYANNGLTVSGGTVKGTGGTARGGTFGYSYGIRVGFNSDGGGGLTAGGGAKVTGLGGAAQGCSYGIECSKLAKLSGSAAVVGVGGGATDDYNSASTGVWCGSLDCSGSVRLTGTGGGSDYRYTAGIVVSEDADIKGGTVVAQGGCATGNAKSMGFYVYYKGTLRLSGSNTTLTCTGGESDNWEYSHGLYCDTQSYGVVVSGGTLNAASGSEEGGNGITLRGIAETAVSVTGSGAVVAQGGNAAILNSNITNNGMALTAEGYIRAGAGFDGGDAVTVGKNCPVRSLHRCSYAVLDGVTPEIVSGEVTENPRYGTVLSCRMRMARGGLKRVVAAWYDADGRLLGVFSKTYEGFPAKLVSDYLPVDADAASYRLLYLDGIDYVRFCEAWDSSATA